MFKAFDNIFHNSFITAKLLESRHKTVSDIIFIMDGSSSAAFTFDRMKEFLIDVVSRFTTSSRFGVLLSGGDYTKFAIKPQNDGTSFEDFKSQVGRLGIVGGDKANLQVSLKDTLHLLKQRDNSAFRKGIPKVFVIFTTSHKNPTGEELTIVREIESLGKLF